MRNTLILFAVLLFAANANAQVVVEDTNLTFGNFGTNVFTEIFQDLNGDSTTVGFEFENGVLTPSSVQVLDELADWYLVNEGDFFDATSIANGDYQTIFALSSNGETANSVFVGDSFFLGVNTGTGFDVSGQPGRGVFGWVEVRNNQGDLEQVGSAVVYGGTGLVVGSTSTSVPEPASLMLLTLGACVLCLRRGRNA